MSEDEISSIAAIRERLRNIETRLAQHAHESEKRAEKLDADLRDLARTVARLSEAVASITVRLNSIGPPSSPLAPSIAAGSASGGVAIATYYLLKAAGV